LTTTVADQAKRGKSHSVATTPDKDKNETSGTKVPVVRNQGKLSREEERRLMAEHSAGYETTLRQRYEQAVRDYGADDKRSEQAKGALQRWHRRHAEKPSQSGSKRS
jgi:hypothetical protein